MTKAKFHRKRWEGQKGKVVCVCARVRVRVAGGGEKKGPLKATLPHTVLWRAWGSWDFQLNQGAKHLKRNSFFGIFHYLDVNPTTEKVWNSHPLCDNLI